jgi:hypothetical protein
MKHFILLLLCILLIACSSGKKTNLGCVTGKWNEIKIEQEDGNSKLPNGASIFSDIDLEFAKDSVTFLYPVEMQDLNETMIWKIENETLYIHTDLRYKIEKMTCEEMILLDLQPQLNTGRLRSYYKKVK